MFPPVFRKLALSLLLLTSGLLAGHGAGMARRTLPDRLPAIVAKLTPLGRLPATNLLHLTIGLPLQHQPELEVLLQQIYDPASPDYRKYLTPQEFTARFGPSESDYAALLNFVRTNGFQIVGTHPNRLIVDVAGTAATAERVFAITLRNYRHPKEARDFFAPDVAPSVAAPITLLNVSGLDNYSLPHPSLKPRSFAARSAAAPNAGSGPGGSYRGNDFHAAYVPGTTLTGAGQSVGLLQFDGYYTNDIASYISQAGLSTGVVLTNVLINGGVPTPGDGAVEVCLDIEMAISMAPGLDKIIVYEGPNGSTAWSTILSRMADDNLARQLSCSWGGGGPDASSEQIFKQMAAQGQSFFNASGDSDAFTGSVPFPSDSTNITQVGGTTLTTTGAGGSYVSETAWNWGNGTGSSGGISTYYNIPGWQTGMSMAANGGSTTRRNIPDVALTGDNVWVVYTNGATGTFGGTSCAAPLWAGFMALVNEQLVTVSGIPASSVGFINPAIYEIAGESIYNSAFHDTTTGNNTSSSSPNQFYAAPGYDLCTGLGTPDGTNFINALLNPDPFMVVPNAGFQAVGSPAGTFIPSTRTFYLTNPGVATLAWSLINTSAWLNVSANNGSLAPGAGDAVVVSLNAAASNLNIGAYPASLWFSNITSGVAHSRLFSLTISDSLVPNGGFETGDFSSWTLNGTGYNANYVDGSGSFVAPHSGADCALLGESGSLAYLSQTLPTVAGQKYLLSLWLNNPLKGSFFNPNEFSVLWNGNTLYDKVNVAKMDWTNMQFIVTATGGSTVLQFGGRHDNYYLGLDDVSVIPILLPAIAVQPTNLTVLAGNNATFRAAAVGSAPLAYQWCFNGASLASSAGISGANTNVLTLAGVTMNRAGNYTLVVTNAFGSVTSSVVTLTVNFIQPVITSVAPGFNGSFNLNLIGAPGSTYVLEATTNLSPPGNWLPLATNTLGTNGVWQFTDTSASNFPLQFYRLKLAP